MLPTAANRFYPTIGNHDWQGTESVAQEEATHPLPAYFQYFEYLDAYAPDNTSPFTLNLSPVDRRIAGFYQKEIVEGLLELFCLNSNLGNPLEKDPHSKLAQMQSAWVQHALSRSKAKWKVVFFHHPPYSTAKHDLEAEWMRLPFDEWGASIVLSGHQHVYERIEHAGSTKNLTYVINGLGGHNWLYEIHRCQEITPGSATRYNAAHGAMTFQVDYDSMRFCFYSVASGGSLVDSHEIMPANESPTSGN